MSRLWSRIIARFSRVAGLYAHKEPESRLSFLTLLQERFSSARGNAGVADEAVEAVKEEVVEALRAKLQTCRWPLSASKCCEDVRGRHDGHRMISVQPDERIRSGLEHVTTLFCQVSRRARNADHSTLLEF